MLRMLVAVSQATRDFHVEQGVDAANCVVLHNGVDLDEFRPRPPTYYLHRELHLAPRSRLLATIGQLGPRKGVDTVLAAAARLATGCPPVHWLVVGERTSTKRESVDFELRLHAMADAPPLAGHLHFLGRREDVPAILNECELLVHAARQEPLGRVLLEAASSGIATVATDVGGTREIFPTESDGALLVLSDEADVFAGAVGQLLRDDAFRQRVSYGVRRRAVQRFNIRRSADRLIELYRETIAAGA